MNQSIRVSDGTLHAEASSSSLPRRGAFAALAGSVAALFWSAARPRAAYAHGNQVTKGVLNNAERETYLRSQVGGDKATLAVANDHAPPTGTGSSYPDGLRVFTTTAAGGAAIQAFGGPGTFSRAPHGGIGVRAFGTRVGLIGAVAGTSVPAVQGMGIFGAGPIGVQGSSPDGTGVRGRGARGIHGISGNGLGVLAEIEEGGTALEARGPVKFSSAGLATIAAGTSSVTVTPGPLLPVDANSKVLCTLQSAGGVLLNVVRNPGNNTFTINLTANATEAVTAAWFLIQ
jgi:hypothetical protein